MTVKKSCRITRRMVFCISIQKVNVLSGPLTVLISRHQVFIRLMIYLIIHSWAGFTLVKSYLPRLSMLCPPPFHKEPFTLRSYGDSYLVMYDGTHVSQ